MITTADLPLISKIDFTTSVYSFKIRWRPQTARSEIFVTSLGGDRSMKWQLELQKSGENIIYVLRLIDTTGIVRPQFVMGQMKLCAKTYDYNPLLQPFHEILDDQRKEIQFPVIVYSKRAEIEYIQLWLCIPIGTVHTKEKAWSKCEPDPEEGQKWVKFKTVIAQNETEDHVYCVRKFLTDCSPVFDCMLYRDWWREGTENEISISDMDSRTVEALLTYMEAPEKFDVAGLELPELENLFYAAEKYFCFELAHECAYHIMRKGNALQTKTILDDLDVAERVQWIDTIRISKADETEFGMQSIIKCVCKQKMNPNLPLRILLQIATAAPKVGFEKLKKECAFLIIAHQNDYMRSDYEKANMLKMASANGLLQLEAFLAVQMIIDYSDWYADLKRLSSPIIDKVKRAYFGMQSNAFVFSSMDVKRM